MGILDEDIARVRAASDIVSIISQHTQLRKVGQRWTGLCPFHNEKSPSFSVNGQEGLYYCFGCQKSGDVITFVREIEHLDFAAAVEWLAGKAGIALTYTDKDEGAGRQRRKRLHEVMARSVEWYHQRLLTGPDAGAARGYLRSRGFDRDMVDEFKVGWAPDRWDELVKYLKVPDDVLVDTGLGMRNKAGRQQDFFRGRILFPIFDDQGRPVAFGGRKLPDAEGPKYQNSRENALYNKSATLYGLNWAKSDIVKANEVVVCEGYTDVIGFFRAGIPRAVATCGTALTEDHIRSLKRFTKRVILAYDADEAGQNAAEKLYAWEERHEIEIDVLAMPKGADPDELSRSDPEALARAVEGSKPFLGFRVSRVLDSADVSTPEGRARAAAAAIEVIREHPSPFMRDQYVMEVAGFCRVEEQQLRAQLAGPPRQRPEAAQASRRSRDADPGPRHDDDGPPLSAYDEQPMGDDDAGGAPRRSRPIGDTAEVEALRLMIHRRAEIEGWLRPVLFGDRRTRLAYEALAASPDLHGALEEASAGLSAFLTQLAVQESTATAEDVASLLLVEAAGRAIASYEAEARHAEDPLAYSPLISWLKLRLDALRGDDSTMESAPELLAWLDENSSEFA
ncbi:MAG: DNA primase [Acidimicrobiales bacterium]